ncbi:PDF receptor-like [Uloborus diversus]|uniref:PDF receptor-like n=1 Tax=Uloborus diversus TaxID=327109 RepID=UPI00240A5FB8|nr:PDF receptor-like [Uloborus diversus]
MALNRASSFLMRNCILRILHKESSEVYCKPVWDGFLCWPSAMSNSIVQLPCPPEKGLDITKFASRQCDPEGRWKGRYPDRDSDNGWSNYTNCFTKEIKLLMDKLYTSTETDVQRKMQIAKDTRVIEMTGLTISLVFLIISIFIFVNFGSLKNKRTRVHKNLFFAMFAQVSIRLFLYTDQWLFRESIDNAVSNKSLLTILLQQPILCEVFYILIEYTRTSVFTWMFLEGCHLHTSVVVVFPKDIKFIYFYTVGWGLPIILVALWSSVMASKYPKTICWWGYALSPYFWVLEGPRMCIIAINFMILLNIVFIVLVKVKVNTPSELQQIRKAVRAALLLLPLLGITNIMDIVPGPIDGTPLQFALWSYTFHAISACHGFFISLLYCFLNKEVSIVRKIAIIPMGNTTIADLPTILTKEVDGHSSLYSEDLLDLVILVRTAMHSKESRI